MSDTSSELHDESHEVVAQHILLALAADKRTRESLEAGSREDIEAEIYAWLQDVLDRGFSAENWDIATVSAKPLVEVLAEALAKSKASQEAVLETCLSLLNSVLREDARVVRFLEQLHAASAAALKAAVQSEASDVESLGFDEEASPEATGEDVHTSSLEKLVMSKEQALETLGAWNAFLETYTEDAAAEALFTAFYEAAPSLQHLFKTSRAVLAGRFFRGIYQLILSLQDGKEAKAAVEILGFRHLELEVTVPRVSCFREAVLDFFQAELGDRLNSAAFEGLRRMFNYVGGGLIYVRENFKERLQILSSSWAIANSDGSQEPDDEMQTMASNAQAETAENSHATAEVKDGSPSDAQKKPNLLGQQSVPTTFREMFCFNAAVMGLEDREWMYEVLKSFDAIVTNVANSYRLQEECDVISLRMAKIPGEVHLSEFKPLMLASLRSLVPKGWDSHHEAAWEWLWVNVEKILQKELGKLAPRGRLVGRYVGSMESHTKEELSGMIYKKFFALAPDGQNYFKQSSSRLLFIVEQIFKITVEVYRDPPRMVDEISALGLRHVGYGIPTEFFSPFVSCVIDSMKEFTGDDTLCDAFAWSLGLVSRILVRTIDEGSTLVMKAINLNSAKHIKRALVAAPRKKRAMWMLKVTVGTQSISPLLWSIQSGSIDAAKAIIEDLLTIRADRDRYYYGVDDLFSRHPDIIQVITSEAPVLLRVLLDRLIWRSRTVVSGFRRVNIYLEHLVIDEEANFADAMYWVHKLQDPTIVTHVVLERLTDLVWNKVIYQPFLRSKVWLLFSLLVFLFSQSILKSWSNDGNANLQSLRVATFVCRCFVYMAGMVELIYTRSRVAIKAIKTGEITRVCQIPLPTKWTTDWQETVSVCLTLILICMFMVEPILFCLQHFEGDFKGAGQFTSSCPEADAVQDFYSILSMFGMFCYFALLVDFSALFVPLSAFVLMAGRVLPQLALSLLASFFLVVVFGTAVTMSQGIAPDFREPGTAMMTLFQISVGMYAQKKLVALESSRWLMVLCMGFIVLVVIFLFNLLIAQLITAYGVIYRTVYGLARLNRMAIICDSMVGVRQRTFRRFVEHLHLDKRMEFSEGDVGIAGGIQILEAANVHPTYEDSIHRYGGSTSPNQPWPEEEEVFSNSIEERLDSLTKIFKRAVKRMNVDDKKRGSASGSSNSMSDSSVGSNLESSE